jgi:DNA polymerase III, delta subunit
MSKEYLEKALAENCLPSALLCSGRGAKEAALDLSARLLATTKDRLASHLDFHCLVPQGKVSLHTIESIRQAIGQSHESAFTGNGVIFLIESADRMQPAAANALLKTLEEPSMATRWILLSDRPQEIIATIASRCTRLSFPEQEGQSVLAGEEVEIVQKLFAQKPPYYQFAMELERIDKLLEGENGQQKTFALLTAVSESLHKLYGNPSGNPSRNPSSSFDIRWEAPLANMAVALERNIKFSTCLEYLFIKLF